MEVSGEAADLVMKEGVQISEEAIKLLARGAKNLAEHFGVSERTILTSLSAVRRKLACCLQPLRIKKATRRISTC